MLISKTDVLSLAKLSNASRAVPISQIPKSFRDDFDHYFLGKTLTKENDIVCVFPHDIKNWVRYIFNKYD